MDQEIRKLYEETSLRGKYSSAHTAIRLHDLERECAARFFTDKKASVLEGGCGSGRFALALEELGYTNITAFDFSRPLIEDAQAVARERKFAVRFVEADACRLNSFEDASARFIFYGANLISLIPMPGRLQALLEARRVLRPDGVFIFTLLNRQYSFKRRLILKAFALKNLLVADNFDPVEMPYLRLGNKINWNALWQNRTGSGWYSAEEAVALATALGWKVLHHTDTAQLEGGAQAPTIFLICTK